MPISHRQLRASQTGTWGGGELNLGVLPETCSETFPIYREQKIKFLILTSTRGNFLQLHYPADVPRVCANSERTGLGRPAARKGWGSMRRRPLGAAAGMTGMEAQALSPTGVLAALRAARGCPAAPLGSTGRVSGSRPPGPMRAGLERF